MNNKEQKVETTTEAAIAIYAMLVGVIFCSCNSQPEMGKYVTKVIDSCEYIEYEYGLFDTRVYSFTHKGNCKFCAERNKK